MEIVVRKIKDLKPAEYNPRQMTEQQDHDLGVSLKRFGCKEPILINKHPDRMDVIIGGHQRCRKWKELGHKTIPTVEAILDLDQERELNLRLNKNVGSWDWDTMANNFDELELMDVGFTAKELDFLDPDDESEQKAPKIDVTHTCPECGHEFISKKKEQNQ